MQHRLIEKEHDLISILLIDIYHIRRGVIIFSLIRWPKEEKASHPSFPAVEKVGWNPVVQRGVYLLPIHRMRRGPSGQQTIEGRDNDRLDATTMDYKCRELPLLLWMEEGATPQRDES